VQWTWRREEMTCTLNWRACFREKCNKETIPEQNQWFRTKDVQSYHTSKTTYSLVWNWDFQVSRINRESQIISCQSTRIKFRLKSWSWRFEETTNWEL